jgi:hypothetical protein
VDGIKARRFHLLTHPDAVVSAFRARLSWLETGVPPASPGPAER